MITEVKSGDTVFALVIDLSSLTEEGTLAVTDASWPLQLLLMKRKHGHVVSKHVHTKIQKVTEQSQEALVVIQGSLQARIFDATGKMLANINVAAGQCLLLVEGGHEVIFTKDSLVYAFKNGPFVDDKISL